MSKPTTQHLILNQVSLESAGMADFAFFLQYSTTKNEYKHKVNPHICFIVTLSEKKP